MARRSSTRNGKALIALFVCTSAFGLQVPAGTEIQVRLKTKV